VFTSIFIRCAGVEQVIPYAELMAALDIANIRELEDLLITECFYSGLVTGKLDQARQCLRVADAASRDVRAADVAPVLDGLAAWCGCARTCMHCEHALLLLPPPLLSGAPPSQCVAWCLLLAPARCSHCASRPLPRRTCTDPCALHSHVATYLLSHMQMTVLLHSEDFV